MNLLNKSNMNIFQFLQQQQKLLRLFYHFSAFCFSCFVFLFSWRSVLSSTHWEIFGSYSSSYRCFRTIVKKKSLELCV